MIDSIAFQTKARTVDHLGREQIADTPTAISELWKNSYDAYASAVSLNIYDGDVPVAVLLDDGHGMNRQEFVDKWLVVGTESKAVKDTVSSQDMNGLKRRTRQGQKGIGRLSSANLGPILLLVSKRKDHDFIAALVDWRLFENPYLNLSDIRIPLTEFKECRGLFQELPKLFDMLMENVWGGREQERATRIQAAWKLYDEYALGNKIPGSIDGAPSVVIASTIIDTVFDERNLAQWGVWNGGSTHGTALLVSNINYDLRTQLEDSTGDAAAKGAKDKFFETLTSFVDPFVDPDHRSLYSRDPQFTYEVKTWKGESSRTVLSTDKNFNLGMVEPLEHILQGFIDEKGVFTGKVKAFGKWLDEECVIEPPDDLYIPARIDSRVGPFELFIASMEFDPKNTTHTSAEYQHFKGMADLYARFMIFRDGLRVLPYGRTDNDFFEIESRRSRHAGREFWNHRQMFGRLAITRADNPNLIDKAGREGILDNKAAKTLKGIVDNILMQSARKYFGSASDLRKRLLPDIQEQNEATRAKEQQQKLKKKQRSKFKASLNSLSGLFPQYISELKVALEDSDYSTEDNIGKASELLDNFKERLVGFRLPKAPASLGSMEETYNRYRETFRLAQDLLSEFSSLIEEAEDQIILSQPKVLLEKQLARYAAQIHKRTSGWKKEIDALQKSEFLRAKEVYEQRNKVFHAEVKPLIEHFERKEVSFKEASRLMESAKIRIDEENELIFEPYIRALESLGESIDLEHLATFGAKESAELQSELDRLNGLAQLGITVEIISHELEAYDDIIGAGIRHLPEEVKSSNAVRDIKFGYDGLTEQLRFLSPLKLSGQRLESWITGEDIYQYLYDFFATNLAKSKISLEATPAFMKFSVLDQQSRLYPVFINLVNNSRYWLGMADIEKRKIILDVMGNKVVISDNGPGVKHDDIDSLFKLFFTRKLRGGRGVGLYLSRANLAAGGHKIAYLDTPNKAPLPGANFIIDFRGAIYE